jgi:ribonuclease HIII
LSTSVTFFPAEPEERELLKNIGVFDSKRISDTQIPKIAKRIKRLCKYKLIKLTPKQYNERRAGKKVTDVLNELHNEVYLGGTHVVDKFPGCTAGHEAVPKAEMKFIEVAAASIIARDAALRQLVALEKKFGRKIPKGSTHVVDALRYLKREGLEPREFVKMDFKNVRQILGR